MGATVSERPRTDLVEQVGARDEKQDGMVTQEVESGKENIFGLDLMELEIEAVTPEEAERRDKVDRFLETLTYDQKMLMVLMIGISDTTIRVDPERLVLVCRKLASMAPESFEFLANRLESICILSDK